MNLFVGLVIIFLLCLNLAVGVIVLCGVTTVEQQQRQPVPIGPVIDV